MFGYNLWSGCSSIGAIYSSRSANVAYDYLIKIRTLDPLNPTNLNLKLSDLIIDLSLRLSPRFRSRSDSTWSRRLKVDTRLYPFLKKYHTYSKDKCYKSEHTKCIQYIPQAFDHLLKTRIPPYIQAYSYACIHTKLIIIKPSWANVL